MKRVKGARILTQYCIDKTKLFDVLETIPDNYSIKSLYWEAFTKSGYRRLEVPQYLKKEGIFRARESKSTLFLDGTIRKKTKQEIKSFIKRLRRKWGDELNFAVRGLEVSLNGSDGVSFRKMRKEIKEPNDKRRKLRVLGMTSPHNAKTNEILAGLATKKIACQIKKEEKDIILCSEVK